MTRTILNLLLAVALIYPAIAQAVLIYDFSSDSGSGQIEFNASSGSSTTGVESFTFDSTLLSYTFTEADISSITWDIDLLSDLTMELNTGLVPHGTGLVGITMRAGTPPTILTPGCLGSSLSGSDQMCAYSDFGEFNRRLWYDPLETTPSYNVPEPATITIFMLGLVAAAYRRYTQRS